ncbi:MAG: hypothetical protein QMD14_06075 [Candidatus Aenigmarchaeota archaeon]|nr:hypothetical protein [Candidatus Aenigmarchaeota archaeon]
MTERYHKYKRNRSVLLPLSEKKIIKTFKSTYSIPEKDYQRGESTGPTNPISKNS